MNREEFERNRHIKSMIRVGTSMIDFKACIGWSAVDDPGKYLKIEFVFETGVIVTAKLNDKQDFYNFLLQIDMFIDDVEKTMPRMQDFVTEIEKECKYRPDRDELPKTLYASEPTVDEDDE